jgi:hypothetical protein
VHFDKRCHVRSVAKVVGVFATCERRAGSRFGSDDAYFFATAQLLTDEREGETCEVGATACASDDDVRGCTGYGHLFDGFLADNGLVHEHVVQHGTQRIFGIIMSRRHFNSFRNGNAEGTIGVWIFRQNLPACIGFQRRA